MLLNCGVGEDSWESLDCREIQSVHHKGNQSWVFFRRIDAETEAPVLWPPDVKSQLIRKDPPPKKRPWCWKGLKAGGEGDNRGQDGWMASLTQWTWVWASSRRWWRTEKPGVLQSMGLQRVGHYRATEQQGVCYANKKTKHSECHSLGTQQILVTTFIKETTFLGWRLYWL